MLRMMYLFPFAFSVYLYVLGVFFNKNNVCMCNGLEARQKNIRKKIAHEERESMVHSVA